MISATIHDLDALARTVWGEARGEPVEGRAAVAHVVLNRARKAQEFKAKNGRSHPLFGNGSIVGACIAAWQFSCWNLGDPNRVKMGRLTLGDGDFMQCVEIALKVIGGKKPDTVSGATHYYADSIAPPKWAIGKIPVAVIGRHCFFNNID